MAKVVVPKNHFSNVSKISAISADNILGSVFNMNYLADTACVLGYLGIDMRLNYSNDVEITTASGGNIDIVLFSNTNNMHPRYVKLTILNSPTYKGAGANYLRLVLRCKKYATDDNYIQLENKVLSSSSSATFNGTYYIDLVDETVFTELPKDFCKAVIPNNWIDSKIYTVSKQPDSNISIDIPYAYPFLGKEILYDGSFNVLQENYLTSNCTINITTNNRFIKLEITIPFRNTTTSAKTFTTYVKVNGTSVYSKDIIINSSTIKIGFCSFSCFIDTDTNTVIDPSKAIINL